jgi:hypothetical protein
MKALVSNLFHKFPAQWVIVLMVAVSVALSCGHAAPAVIIMALYALCSFIFNVVRQIYWRITKTGDYAYLQKSKETVPTDSETDLA